MMGALDIERTTFLQRQQFYSDLLPYNLKINREYLLSKVNHCIKFKNLKAKGQKDIEQIVFVQTSSLLLTLHHTT